MSDIKPSKGKFGEPWAWGSIEKDAVVTHDGHGFVVQRTEGSKTPTLGKKDWDMVMSRVNALDGCDLGIDGDHLQMLLDLVFEARDYEHIEDGFERFIGELDIVLRMLTPDMFEEEENETNL